VVGENLDMARLAPQTSSRWRAAMRSKEQLRSRMVPSASSWGVAAGGEGPRSRGKDLVGGRRGHRRGRRPGCRGRWRRGRGRPGRCQTGRFGGAGGQLGKGGIVAGCCSQSTWSKRGMTMSTLAFLARCSWRPRRSQRWAGRDQSCATFLGEVQGPRAVSSGGAVDNDRVERLWAALARSRPLHRRTGREMAGTRGNQRLRPGVKPSGSPSRN
jgi:hypothetical protein